MIFEYRFVPVKCPSAMAIVMVVCALAILLTLLVV